MKNLILILCFLTSVVGAHAQGEPNVPAEPFDYMLYKFRNYIEVGKGIIFPTRDTNWTPRGPAITHYEGVWYGYIPSKGFWEPFSHTINDQQTKLIQGGEIFYKGTGFDFFVNAAIYRIDGQLYVTDSASFTLNPSDSTYDRFDVPRLTTSGFEVLDGIPSEPAAIPQVDGDEIALTAIKISALSTSPDFSLIYVYNENIEGWTITNVGTTTNPNYSAVAANIWTGSKSLEITNWNNNDRVLISRDAGPVNTLNYTGFAFAIKLKQTMVTSANIRIAFFSNGVQVSNEVTVAVNKNSLVWQLISMSLSSFNITNYDIDSIRIRYTRTNSTATHSGAYIDAMHFIAGLPQTGSNPGVETVGLEMPSIFTVENSPLTGNGGVIRVRMPGSSTQIVYADGVARTDNAIKDVGTYNSLSSDPRGAQKSGSNIIFQDATDANPGMFNPFYKKTVDTLNQLTAENMGNGLPLLREITPFRTGFRSLIFTGDVDTTGSNDTTLVVDVTGGGSGARFGFSGEDDEASENRSFQFDADTYTFSIGGTSAANGSTFGINNTDASNFGFYGSGVLGNSSITVPDGSLVLYSEFGYTHLLGLETTTSDAVKIVVADTTGGSHRLFLKRESEITGGGSGANTALSNLASVAINTSLLPSSANTHDFGSDALPWKDAHLYGAYFKGSTSGKVRLQAVATAGDNTILLPSNSGTLVLREDNLGVFASSTSAHLSGLLSDETGSGAAVFGTSPTISNPSVSTTNPALTLSNPTGSGNAGIWHEVVLDGDNTLTNTSSAQTCFPSGYDTWTLQGNTLYEFEGSFFVTTASGTSYTGGMGFALGGGITITSALWFTNGYKATDGGNATAQATTPRTSLTTTDAMNVASTTGGYVIEFKGKIRVGTGGTLTPEIKTSAAVSPVLKANSSIKFRAIGSGSFTSIGPVN